MKKTKASSSKKKSSPGAGASNGSPARAPASAKSGHDHDHDGEGHDHDHDQDDDDEVIRRPLAPGVRYRRILLKLSGEALMGKQGYGIDPATLSQIADEVIDVQSLGVEVALVIGGGNIFRGVAGASKGMDRAHADYMGMLATIINALAMQVAAMNPQYVAQDDVPAAVVEKEKAIRLELAKTSGKPEAVWPKIIEGQIAKWFKEVCLLDQVWMKDPDGKKDIRALQTDLVAKTGENVKIRRFVRYEVGEGLEKRSDDFVEEVKRQAGQS